MIKTLKLPILFAVLFAAVLIFIIGHYYFFSSSSDAEWYIKIAKGDIKDAVQPFASRVLHPMIVRVVSFFSGLDISLSFYVVNVFLLLSFVFILSLFFSEISFMNPPLVFVVLFTPFLLDFHRNFYMSDVLFGFLAALFFFSLKRKNIILSLSLLFILFFSRPADAMVLGVILLVVSFYKKEMKLAKASLVVILFAYLLISLVITPLGAPNIHNISNLTYRSLQPIYYFVRSVLGIDWMMSTQVQYCQPKFLIYPPSWIHLGGIKWIGVCGFNIVNPLSVIFYSLITFGLIPGMLFSTLRKNWRQFFTKNEVWLLVAMGYGILVFFLGILVPNLRTVSYGWPAFWLAGFYILDRQIRQWPVEAKKSLIKLFTIVQAVLLWVPYLIVKNLPNTPETLKYFLALFVVAFLYLIFIRRYSITAKKYNIVL
ncbi:MAG: hypothetical protein AAB432_00505 [Patescibacteria group bacterium]